MATGRKDPASTVATSGDSGGGLTPTERRRRALLGGGLIGGPLSIYVYTPLRNAITLGAKDGAATGFELYARCMRPRITVGWTGALAPTVMSAPQFLAMGPAYHAFADIFGPSLAVFPTALAESTISFGSQCRNAQRAYNVSVPAQQHVPLQNPLNPLHRGFASHVARNCLAMSGIRVLSPVSTELVAKTVGSERASEPGPRFAADFMASVAAAALSAPANQLFNYLAVSPNAKWNAVHFLRDQYFMRNSSGSWRISPLALRDVLMRCAYIAPQLSTFVTVERLFLRWYDCGPESKQ